MLEDDGKWQCEAENSKGYIENGRPIQLVVLGMLLWLLTPIHFQRASPSGALLALSGSICQFFFLEK